MKRIALALIACAGCGLLAGRTQPEPPAVACSPAEPAETTSAVRSDQPAETPLIAKLLPGGGASEAPSKAAPPALRDGQLSPGGNFSFSGDRNIWVPVDKGNRRFTNNGRPVTAAHLIAEHNHHPSCANYWTQRELDIAHANDHAGRVRTDGYFAPTGRPLPLGGTEYKWSTKSGVAPKPGGHWEYRTICNRRGGCDTVRVWVQD